MLRDVLITSQAEGRMMALRGTVRYGRETEHLRFRVDDASFRAPWPSSRLELRTPVALLTGEGGDDEEAHEVLTHDVGPDGVLLHESTELALCGTVAVRLTLPGDDEPVLAVGRVRPGMQGGRTAVDFERIASIERSRIRAYVSTHLRDRLKLAQAAQSMDEHF